MSLLDHLEELRSRLLRALGALAAAYVLCLAAAEPIWRWVQAPLQNAAAQAGAKIVALTVNEELLIVYVSTPLLASLFVAAPFVLYEAWAFVAPGLYRHERKRVLPVVASMAALFLAGGAFAYTVVLPYSLIFLVGIGRPMGIERFVSISSYYDSFVNVMLGVSVAFELPMVVFFLTLLGIVTPGWLMRNSRYAVLAIAFLAAVVTPSPNVFDMMMFCVPMLALYFLGVLASYLLVRRRASNLPVII